MQVVQDSCPVAEDVPAGHGVGGAPEFSQLYPAGHIELPEPAAE